MVVQLVSYVPIRIRLGSTRAQPPRRSHDTSTFSPIELAFLPFVWYFLVSSNGSCQSDGAVREIYQVVIDGSAILKYNLRSREITFVLRRLLNRSFSAVSITKMLSRPVLVFAFSHICMSWGVGPRVIGPVELVSTSRIFHTSHPNSSQKRLRAKFLCSSFSFQASLSASRSWSIVALIRSMLCSQCKDAGL